MVVYLFPCRAYTPIWGDNKMLNIWDCFVSEPLKLVIPTNELYNVRQIILWVSAFSPLKWDYMAYFKGYLWRWSISMQIQSLAYIVIICTWKSSYLSLLVITIVKKIQPSKFTYQIGFLKPFMTWATSHLASKEILKGVVHNGQFL